MGGSVVKIKESITIPLYNSARWEMKADLSGKRYGIYIAYNTRQDAWFMAISDTNENLLLAGIRLVPGIFFLEKYRASVPGLPPGDLWLVDIEGKLSAAEVTRENLSTRFALTYTIFGE
jgi:hypothetical protein